jgi:hypothetical protein
MSTIDASESEYGPPDSQLQELAINSMIDRGLKDADADDIVSNEEALQRIRRTSH